MKLRIGVSEGSVVVGYDFYNPTVQAPSESEKHYICRFHPIKRNILVCLKNVAEYLQFIGMSKLEVMDFDDKKRGITPLRPQELGFFKLQYSG